MDLMKGILPLLLIIVVYLILRIPIIKYGITSATAIKARIVLGCLGAGVFLGIAIFSGDIKEIFIAVLIAGLIIYGAVSLQNKYLIVKK